MKASAAPLKSHSSHGGKGNAEGTALRTTSRLVEIWNRFAAAPPFAELKEGKRFTDRKSAVTGNWTVAQRLGAVLEDEMSVAEQDMPHATKAAKPISVP